MAQQRRQNPTKGPGSCGRFAALLVALAFALAVPRAHAAILADFVFVIDTSRSMANVLPVIADQITSLPIYLQEEGIDPDNVRYSIVAFGTNRYGKGPVEPRLELDFTDSVTAFAATMEQIIQQERTFNTESGTEAIDFALDQLAFRPEAVRNLILITDENDDRPASIQGSREPPRLWNRSPATPFFQARLNSTAQGLIDENVLLNMIINPSSAPSLFQYGNPNLTQLRTDGRLDLVATLANLEAGGYEESLQGQLLAAGIVSRAFKIKKARSDPDVFWEDFFRAKAQEIVPEPGTFGLLLGALLGTALLRRTR